MVYELLGISTENYNDVRWREYTTSKKKAARFSQIPRIQFSDSGHGIEFFVTEHARCHPNRPVVREVWAHVEKHMVRS